MSSTVWARTAVRSERAAASNRPASEVRPLSAIRFSAFLISALTDPRLAVSVSRRFW